MPRCDQCRFFHAHPPAPTPEQIIVSANGIFGGGECRRHPPLHAERETYVAFPFARFPIVANDGWCGEFEPSATSPRDRDVCAKRDCHCKGPR